MTITLPHPSPSLNTWMRMHFHKRSKIEKEIRMVVLLSARQAGPHAMRKAKVTITRHSAGELDYDNLVGGCKPFVDALTRAGLIVDDSPDWVIVEYIQKQAPRRGGRTEIQIEYL